MNALDELNARLGIGPSLPKLPIALQGSGYEAERLLGKGSFGNAYLVRHRGRGKHYVVKHVNMSNMTPRQRKDAHREIIVLQQLNYPNIIRYVEFFEEFPHLYIVMEYADGGDVYTHLKNLKKSMWALGSGRAAGLTEEQVICLFVQTTMAVKYMHDRRLLHRDIKSQNVFLTQDHVVKLGDFGISTVLMSTVAMAKTMCGTPCYFSPELCLGKPYNNKSDVWALGVLLYELCTTGRLPFEANTMNKLMDEICNREPRRIPSNFSDELWQLILWMLKKDPRQRPDAEQILRTPVLVRAIPGVVKKMSELGSDYENQYKCLLTSDVKPPPIVKNRLNVLPVRPPAQLNAGKAADKGPDADLTGVSSPSLGILGRLELLRKQNGDYPFIRMGDGWPKQGLESPAGSPRVQAPQPMVRKIPPNVSRLPKPDEQLKSGALARLSPDCREKGGVVPHQSEGPCDKAVDVVNADERHDAVGTPTGKKGTKDNVDTPSAQKRPVLNHSFGRVPLQELFLMYDASKKRLAEKREKQQKEESSSESKRLEVGAKDLLPPVPQRNIQGCPRAVLGGAKPERVSAAEHQEVAARCSIDPSQIKGVGMNKCDAGREAEGEPPHEVVLDHGGGSRSVKAEDEPSGDLARVLREMTEHFEHVKAVASCAESRRSTSVAHSSPKHLVVTPGGSSAQETTELTPEDECGQDFPDAMGTTLDVQELRRQSVPPVHILVGKAKGCGAEERVPLFIEQYDVAVPDCAMIVSHPVDKVCEQAYGEGGMKNIEDNLTRVPNLSSGETGVPSAAVVTGGNVAHGSADLLFTGSCLCSSVYFQGQTSYIFGSFVCNCVVCARFSGSVTGVEWMHLPDVPFELLFAEGTRPPVGEAGLPSSQSPIAGTGAAAAQALSKPEPLPTGDVNPRSAMDGDGYRSPPSVRLPPHLSKFALEVPMRDENGVEQRALYNTYYCGKCGSTVAMEHGSVEGSVIAKAALSPESLTLLEMFQQTVPLDEAVVES